MRYKVKPRTSQGFAAFLLRHSKTVFVLLLCALMPQGSLLAELQNSIVTKDAVGTIGYLDQYYFTVILKTNFTKEGDEEIGFFITDTLQLPPMLSWGEIKSGMAVRVSYEEVRSPEKAKVSGVESQWTSVLERKAIRLVIGQKLKRKALVS